MCTPWVTTIEASIDAFNKAVSIGADEELMDDIRAVAKRIGKRTYVLYAYDGVFAGFEANRKVCGESICGVFYVVAVNKNGQPTSMTENQMLKYMMKFYKPEYYTSYDVLSNWSDQLLKELDDMAV
jgi:hypothetical protein